jgi:hypothetical protein
LLVNRHALANDFADFHGLDSYQSFLLSHFVHLSPVVRCPFSLPAT